MAKGFDLSNATQLESVVLAVPFDLRADKAAAQLTLVPTLQEVARPWMQRPYADGSKLPTCINTLH